MSDIETYPISHALGDRNASVKVERSWSENLPVTVGANAPVVQELDREKMILNARPSGRRSMVGEQLEVKSQKIGLSSTHNFFVVKGKTLEFIGSKEVDVSKFIKDISGRSFRVWLKGAFPDRTDYDDIAVFEDICQVKQMVELLG